MESDRSDEERIARLREENEFLRQAARTFGELAERLADELHARQTGVARLPNTASRRQRRYTQPTV